MRPMFKKRSIHVTFIKEDKHRTQNKRKNFLSKIKIYFRLNIKKHRLFQL